MRVISIKRKIWIFCLLQEVTFASCEVLHLRERMQVIVIGGRIFLSRAGVALKDVRAWVDVNSRSWRYAVAQKS